MEGRIAQNANMATMTSDAKMIGTAGLAKMVRMVKMAGIIL